MRNSTFHYIEDILRDYPRTDKIIAAKEQELREPYHPGRDNNVGGGHRQNYNNMAVENMALTIADDRTLRNLQRRKLIVGEALQRSDPDTLAIIKMLYLDPHGLTVTGVAMQLHLGRSAVSRKRTAFFERLGHQLGYWC